MRTVAIAILTAIAFLLNAPDLPASESGISSEKAIRAIVGEASGEPYLGKLAVACAIRNRGTLRGVYGVNAKHVDKQPQWVWRDARRAWEESARRDVTGGAQFWEGCAFKTPYWAKGMTVTGTIGNQRFYRRK